MLKAVEIALGLLAVTMLVLMIVDMVKTEADSVQIAVLFIITAMGGIALFYT